MATKPKKTATSSKAAAPKKKAAPAKAASAFNKPLQPSKELAAVVGASPMPRTEVVSKVWEYIKKHKLQNAENKREILADDKLKAVFGKDKVTMFEMNKFLAQHLK
jgi:upstream activation factor subunit UAF30